MPTPTRRPAPFVGRAALLLAPAALALGLVACSSSGSLPPDTTAETIVFTTPSTATTTTASSTTTTTSSTTISSPTSTSTTVVETTAPPAETPAESTAFPTTPTLYPTDDPRAEVEAANSAIQQWWIGCLAALPTCDTAQLPNYYSGGVLASNQDMIGKFNSGGVVANRVDEYVEVLRSVDVSGDTATVEICEFDPIGLTQPDPNGGPDRVVFDEVESRIVRSQFLRGSDGLWRVTSGSTVQSVKGGQSLCDS